jgi:hypothetical protein
MKSTAKGSKTSHKQTDELARYIKEFVKVTSEFEIFEIEWILRIFTQSHL